MGFGRNLVDFRPNLGFLMRFGRKWYVECPQNYMLYHCTLFLCSVSVAFVDLGTMQQFPVECE